MKDWWKFGLTLLLFLALIISLFAVGSANHSKKEQEFETEAVEAVPAETDYEAPQEIQFSDNEAACKDAVFDGITYKNGAYIIDGKIYLDSELISKGYGFKSIYNVDKDLVNVSKSDKVISGYIRYTIKEGEYYFYSEDIEFATFDEEVVSITQLEEKGIFVSVNYRNTRSENWDPSYVTDFVFNYNGITYKAKGKPYVYLTIDEDYTVTRPEVDVTNLGWRIIENGNVVLERNAANEYSYRYFGNTPGNTYQVCLTAYFDGYEVISNIVEYTVE